MAGQGGRVPRPPLLTASQLTQPSLGVTPGEARASHTRGLGGLCPQCSLQMCGFSSFSSQLDSISVKHAALSLVSVILKRALKTIEHCLNKETWQELGVYTAAAIEEFVRLFREALSKVGAGAGFGLSGEVSGAFLTAVTGKHARWKRQLREHRGRVQNET